MTAQQENIKRIEPAALRREADAEAPQQAPVHEDVATPPPGNEPLPEPRSRRLWVRRGLLSFGPLAVLLIGGYVYLHTGRYVGTDNAYVKADKVIISAQVDGPITEVDVAENQHVNKGQVLFRIDPSPYRIKLARARAQLKEVRTQIQSLKAQYRQKTEELALAQTNEAFAKREYQRHTGLAHRKVISEDALDQARHELDVATRQIAVTRQERDQIASQLDGNPGIPVEQHPDYLAAKYAVDGAQLDLQHTVVHAPFAGTASKTPDPGLYVSPGQAVMSIVSHSHMWIEANFKETQLTHVKHGQPVSIEVDTYPSYHWTGKVRSIAQATGAEFSILPPQNATGNWVKVLQRIPVRIAIDAKPGGPALRDGMSTEVEVDTGHQRTLAGLWEGLIGAIKGLLGFARVPPHGAA